MLPIRLRKIGKAELDRMPAATKKYLLTLALCTCTASSGYALDFDNHGITGSFDTTLSYGASWRVQGRDKAILGQAGTPETGQAFSVNGDNGNLNYDKGLVSHAFKVTSELALNYRNFGTFWRGTAFYDFENKNGNRNKIDLTNDALDSVGSDANLLDAYAYIDLDIADRPLSLRVGEQVISWGESTFIQGGINVINPIDVSKLRVPGAELREALLPEGLLQLSFGPSENSSLEVFWQYDWDDVEIDPPGTYFSSNDFAGDGGDRLMLGFGRVPDNIGAGPEGLVNAGLFDSIPVGAVVPRDPDQRPADQGQYGVALRFFLSQLNDTEIAAYYINYHSRLPIINGRTGTIAAIIDPRTGLPAGALAGDYAGSAAYFLSFPEDIKLYGLSFNTEIGNTGIALQGEISHKRDAPLQVDDVEILFATLSPLNPLVGNFGQLGDFPVNTVVPGFIRRNVTQVQATATQLFANVLGGDELLVLGEIGYTHIHGMPSKDKLRLDAPGTYISGNAPLSSLHFGVIEDNSRFADADSWGYRLISRLTFNNAIGAVTLQPSIAWQHDVQGITPGPGGNFIAGRKALTFGIKGSYQNAFEMGLSYTNFFGAGRQNLLNDRDFIALNFKYSL